MLSTVALLQGDTDAATTQCRRRRAGLPPAGPRPLRRPGEVLPPPGARRRRPGAGQRRAACRASPTSSRPPGGQVPALEARVLAGRLALTRGRRDGRPADLAAGEQGRRSGPADARARGLARRGAAARGRRPAAGRDAPPCGPGCASSRTTRRPSARPSCAPTSACTAARWPGPGCDGRRGRRRARGAVVGRARPGGAPALRPAPAARGPGAGAGPGRPARPRWPSIEEARTRRRDDAALLRRQVALERRIRDRCRASGDGTRRIGPAPPTPSVELRDPSATPRWSSSSSWTASCMR